MRTDVKVGLFVGIGAVLLAGWLFWPKPNQKPAETVPVGGRDSLAVDQPIVRPQPMTEVAPRPVATTPPAMTDTTAPIAPLGETPAVPAAPSSAGEVAAAPTEALPTPSMGMMTSPQPMVPSSAVQTAGGKSAGPAAIGREPLVHVVRAGDTLEKIADAYYGKTSLAGALRQANPQIGPSKDLRTGMKITLPAETDLPAVATGSALADASSRVSSASPVAAPKVTTTGDDVSALGPSDYKVQKGDTLYAIAKKHLGSGKRWQELLDLNSQILRGKASNLRPGMVLRLASTNPAEIGQ